MVAHQSAAAARQYYTQGLRREDYYSEGQEIIGQWHGKAAERLGLTGDVTPEAFASLVENRHPGTEKRLTPRTKVDRRVGYDINFHAPKSLSILHGVTGDKELLNAFRSSVAETMEEMEKLAAVRVRKGGANGQRVTGNIAWAEFVHFTARPVGGMPDPHLHVHAFTFNTSFDEAENRWKAGEFHDLKQQAPFFEAAFHARLAGKIAELGYGVERSKFGWEIAGIPRTLIETFSRRSALIDRLADEKGITDAKARDGLGAASREGKRYGITGRELRDSWLARMSHADKAAIAKVYRREASPVVPIRTPEKMTAGAALDHAVEKLFEKNSVVEKSRLLAEALRAGVGQVTESQLNRAFERKGLITRKTGGVELCTTRQVLAEEVALISFARSGRNQFAPVGGRGFDFKNDSLSAEQNAAIRHLLTSKDQVMLIRGGAGVGKTTLMKEAVAQIEARGFKVFAFAPSASASRETLRAEGFGNANTVAHLLSNREAQRAARGQFIWIDEAGLLGTRDLWRVAQIAGSGARVILSGDHGQHAPVARGNPFRMLQRFAGIRTAEVTQIRRQEREDYREAVSALSKADLKSAFRRLDSLGAVTEIREETERYRQLAADYLALSRKGSTPLVVSPTHAESGKVTSAIREAKREAGQLGAEKMFRQLHNVQWEEADRRRPENYTEGLVIQFHQNAPGIRRGAQIRVLGLNEKGEVRALGADGKEKILPLKHPDRFQVFEERSIAIAKGDRIRITRNGETADGRRISNGNEFTVEKIDRSGNLILSTGGVLNADHGHLNYGYCSTSHSSQSKTVRDVLVAQSAESFVAASREQFYVSVSRGKESIRIYTDSREGLERAVGNSSQSRAGIELAGFSKREVAAFMSSEMGGRQWREAVASRRAEDGTRSFVNNLLKERQQNAQAKEAGHSWKQYVEARRANTTSDGKNRSRGYPQATKGRQGDIQNKYRSFARPHQLSTATQEKMKAAEALKAAGKNPVPEKTQGRAKPSQPAKPSRTEALKARGAKAYETAAANFKKIVNRQNAPARDKARTAEATPRTAKQLPAGDSQKAARHSAKQKQADAAAAAQKTAAKSKEMEKARAATQQATVKKGK